MMLLKTVVVACLLTLLTPVLGQGYGSPCCIQFQQAFPGQTIFPEQDQYSDEKASYWSALAGKPNPACFVRPRTTLEVSTMMQILNNPSYENEPGCKFAIRSGGHTTWAGNNIQGGVTIDLSLLNSLGVSQDRKIVSLGPGSRWNRVYQQLEPYGIAVGGGRWGNVGVGGFLTGGGLSFFQGARGPACDSIINHEVVLANGTIVNANRRTNPDLHRALKGGNNNFGIVTRFDIDAWPQSELWYAQILGQPGRQAIPMRWFEQFAAKSNRDPYGMIMFYTMYTPGAGWSHRSFVTYDRPQSYPPVFSGLVQNSAFTTQQTMSYQSIADLNMETTPAGTRSSFSTFTYVNSAAYMNRLLDVTQQFADATPGVGNVNLIFQPLWTTPRANSFNHTGGNSLGLENDSSDLVIVLLHILWTSPQDDKMMREAIRSYIFNAKQMARQMKVHHDYLYANYAEEWQDVMSSYGAQNLEILRNISVKYDPTGIFQKRVPGGYKLWRKPGQGSTLAQDIQLLPENPQYPQWAGYPGQNPSAVEAED